MHFSKCMKSWNEDGTHTVQDDCQDDLQCARQRTDNVCSLTPHSRMWSWWWTNSIKALDCYVPPHCLGAWCVCHDYEPSPSLYIQFIIFSQTPPPPAVALYLLFCSPFFFPLSLPFFWLGYFFVSSSSFISHLIDCCRLHFFFLFLLSIILLRARNYFDFLNSSYLLFSDLCVRGKRHLVRFFCSVFKIYRLLPCCDRDSPEGHASCCVSR